MIKKYLLFSFSNYLFWAFLILPVQAEEPVKIGVLAKRGAQVAMDKWADTAAYLSKEIAGYTFEIVPLGFKELSIAVRDGRVDFVLTNTAYYVELQYLYGLSRIATLKNLGSQGEVLTRFGGVIFTRSDSSLYALNDLKNKRFGAVDSNSFGGWIMARKELLNHGVTRDDFSKFIFLGSHDKVVKAVESGRINAGTVRSDTLERMAGENLIRLSDFKVLAKKRYPDFPYMVSTELYPEWPFAKLSATSDALTGLVVVALLKMPQDSPAAQSAKIAGWTTALDYSKVHHLLQELHLGPFAQQTKKLVITTEEVSIVDLFSPEELMFFSAIFLVIVYLVFKRFKYGVLLNIKMSHFNILLVLFELGMIFFLIYEVIVLERLEHQLGEEYENQHAMVNVADQLRQSSDDLTHFARTYVVTGKDEFKRRYYRTLDIRSGNAPRPKNYDRIYWDLNNTSRNLRHPAGKKLALKKLFQSLPFTDEELDLLRRSESNLNDLVSLEVEAFEAMVDDDQQRAIALLHSPAYYDAKHKIMLPIDIMMTRLTDRINAENKMLHRKVDNQINLLLLVGFFFVGGNLIIYILMRKKVNKPVAYLTNVIKKFETGDTKVRQRHFYNDEIGYMITQFFSMHATIEHEKQRVEELLQRIEESIDYAAFIQRALVPRPDVLDRAFDDSFTIWEPRDVVGGDIFLLESLHRGNETLLMVIDCTGHGVPGALVTVLAKAVERQMVATIERTGEKVSPAKLLAIFNRSIKHLLQQDHSDTIANVGFDGTIVYYNRQKNLIRFAGANTSLFSWNGNDVTVIKGDRQSIGYKSSNSDYCFTDHEIVVDVPLSIYLPTDGYLDQNGGEKSLPFGRNRFIKLIEQCGVKPMDDQRSMFHNALDAYQKGEPRNDDLTLVAFKVIPVNEETEHSSYDM
nr:PhnD/SsuA/transferrin family substrate-binding protein [uncultured Desulfuromonas sp.]